MQLTIHVLQSVFNIALPFGFSFGALYVFLFSIPLMLKFIKQIF